MNFRVCMCSRHSCATADFGACLLAAFLLFALAACNVHVQPHNVSNDHEHQLRARRRATAQHAAVTPRGIRCPPGCSAHGVCNQEIGRCDCPRLSTGPSCQATVPDIKAVCAQLSILEKGGCRSDLPCFNNCNGKGECDAGICRCQPGYWGIDCAISWGRDGKPQLLGGRYQPRKTGVKIYIYELPFNMTTWWSYTRQDRPMQYLLWQRITSSGVRTLDGAQADYYLLPVFTRGTQGQEALLWALDYIRRTYPWWSRDGGHRHLVMHTGDFGIRDFTTPFLDQHMDELANMTWLTHWGLSKTHAAHGWRQSHWPGKDLVIPIILGSPGYETSPLNSAVMAAAKAAGRDLDGERNGTFFFAGRICGDRSSPDEATGNCSSPFHGDYSLGVRQAVFFHHRNRTGYKVVTQSNAYLQDMATHKFCLAPPGGGYGKRQVLVSLMGCVPVLAGDGVLQPFEPELDWSRVGVAVRERDLPRLHEILEAVPAEELAAKQKRLRCMAQHLYYSSSLGAVLGDDGRYDAFETLLEILRVRRAHPELPPDQYGKVDERFRKFVDCQLDGPDPLPLCTRSEHRQSRGRLTCEQCTRREGLGVVSSFKVPGGMACCGNLDQAKCPRAWE